MERVGCVLLGLSVLLSSVSATRHEILPRSPDDSSAPSGDILNSLNYLQETLNNHQVCDDRFEKIWDALSRRSKILKDSKQELFRLLDELSRVYAQGKAVEVCSGDYRKVGNGCYYLQPRIKWPWWRTRGSCWFLGGEMIHPENLEEIRRFLPTDANDKYWIGGSTSAELEFPNWLTESGERIGSDADNFTTIPRSSPEANCLAVDVTNTGYQIVSLDCEVKLTSLCQQRTKYCPPVLTKPVGENCAKLLGYYREVSWENARDGCVSDGARLAIVKDFDVIRKFFSGKYEYSVWIGAKRETGYGFKWLDNTVVNFTLHRHDESTEGDCLALSSSSSGPYQTVKYPCDTELKALCFT